jgi:mannose-6-phosphate isomerase-like protein (cupin superfamily)
VRPFPNVGDGRWQVSSGGGTVPLWARSGHELFYQDGNAMMSASVTCMTDVWVYQSCPSVISGGRDDGRLPFSFEPPERGGHLRIVQTPARPQGYDPARDPTAVPLHEPRQRPGGTWDKGGANAFSSPVHKSETVDYGIVLEGERVMLLDDGEYVMKPGDVVVQLGNWHGWCNPREGSLMAFVMMGAKFED